MERFPTLHRDPTMPVAAAGRRDRLEVVRTRGPRHRRPVAPVPPGPPATPPTRGATAALVTALVAVLVPALVTVLVAAHVTFPAPLAALVVLAALPGLGAPLLRLTGRLTGLAVPDPLGRFVITSALGLVLLTALDALARLADLTADPLTVTAVVAALLVAGRFVLPTAPGPVPALRPLLPLAALLLLPALAWIDVGARPTSPGWLRAAVLVAGLALLARATLSRTRTPRRTRVAATLYALAVAVLTPFAGTGTDRWGWSTTLAGVFSTTESAVARIVLPAVAGLVVVAVWAAAERVLGPARAVVVATLVLAVLVTTPPGWGDLAVGAAVLLVASATGERSPRALTGRRVLVLVLAAGALLLAPSAAVFAAQGCLAALVGLVLGRPRRGGPGGRDATVFTLPVALGLAVAVWVATNLRSDVTLGTGSIPVAAVVLAALAALGLLALLSADVSGGARRHGDFLLLVAGGLLLQVVATAGGATTSVLPHVLLVATVPAVLGVAALWAVLAGGAGLALDRVPVQWLRAPARATRGHRLPPVRAARTALVALALFAVVYARKAFG